ncbi:hypothetical protein B0A48_16166 [Cryoendolithus antarcticus]|uniref:Uncharacterized protein n=1 Tax=Cryoendolithus antarcticus TaxID=1507870 RepID=A0A1V8SFE6_9PEZI|nr:hypothetical protein B0A48_16166 [Cryoendolithus antarcticus]
MSRHSAHDQQPLRSSQSAGPSSRAGLMSRQAAYEQQRQRSGQPTGSSISAAQDPPPYTSVYIPEDESAVLLQTLSTVVAHEQDAEYATEEVERLRKFLRYCLCVDYRCDKARVSNVTISTADHDHYIHLSRLLQFNAGCPCKITDNDRERIAPVFWKHIHEPCKALHMSVECVAMMIMRFNKYQGMFAGYKGSPHVILRDHGLEALAQKVWTDWHLVLPAICARRTGYLEEGMIKLAQQYFVHVDGVFGNSAIGPEPQNQPRAAVPRVAYTATARGQAYGRNRYKMFSLTRNHPGPSKLLSENMIDGMHGCKNRRPVSQKGGCWNSQTQLTDTLERQPTRSECREQEYTYC